MMHDLQNDFKTKHMEQWAPVNRKVLESREDLKSWRDARERERLAELALYVKEEEDEQIQMVEVEQLFQK